MYIVDYLAGKLAQQKGDACPTLSRGSSDISAPRTAPYVTLGVDNKGTSSSPKANAERQLPAISAKATKRTPPATSKLTGRMATKSLPVESAKVDVRKPSSAPPATFRNSERKVMAKKAVNSLDPSPQRCKAKKDITLPPRPRSH